MSYPQKTNAAELALRASIQPIEIDYSEIRAAKKQTALAVWEPTSLLGKICSRPL